MKKIIIAVCAMVVAASASAQSRADGFYKDLFMDSGTKLNTYQDLPAVKLLNLKMERICTYDNVVGMKHDPTEFELGLMKSIFAGSETDANGVLLYPDGAPRFKVIYVNGGKSASHGEAVTAGGRDNIRKFFANGGSYVGTCAGAYFCSKGVRRSDGSSKEYETYLGIFPALVRGTALSTSATGLTVEKKCPLLKYYDFGGDYQIDSVRHNGGCYLPEDNIPEGTELLMRYIGDTLKLKNSIHKTVNAWAYKASEQGGRIVVTGSHPERMISGDRLQMFAGMIRYAIEGNGKPQIKAELESGVARRMVKETKDNVPESTCIGDKQYHHFTIEVPKGAKELEVELKSMPGRDNYDLFIYASDKGFAFNDVAQWFNVLEGVDKKLVIPAPKAGKMYISVFCDTTVDTVDTEFGERYTGRIDVLNGVPYIVKATVK